MFFFTGYTVTNILVFILALAILIALNELTRRSKVLAIICYIAIPVVFTFLVWPKSNAGGTWFSWAKTYSALAGVLIFMAIRYIPRLEKNKVMLTLPPVILALNILEAVAADIECFFKNGEVEAGLEMWGGPWNIINAIAGIILIITITGWLGIRVSEKKSRDMIWADQLWFWIVAYDLWNLSYCYNTISNRSFYAGFLLLVACTVVEFTLSRGAWLQHRAQTLALFAMFSITFDYTAWPGLFTITSTQSPAPKMILAILSIASNVAVLVYEIYTIRKTRKNPLKEPIYTELKSYQTIMKANGL